MSCTFELTWEDSKPNRHLNIVFNLKKKLREEIVWGDLEGKILTPSKPSFPSKSPQF